MDDIEVVASDFDLYNVLSCALFDAVDCSS
jgi:hypothetical protein